MARDGSTMETTPALNESQQRHLLTNVQYADKLLSEIEEILTAASSKSPFPKYQVDVTPAQTKVIQDYIARIRAQMLRVLEGQQIPVPGPQFGAIHSIRVTLAFVRIALIEIGPKYMRGYGEVPTFAVAELEGLVTELNALVDKLNAYLAQGLGQDLGTRLAKLEWTGDEAPLLRKLESIISAHGLVEFRPKLAMILDRLETRRFEIAVFGRVSSGKSSLLNHILQVDALPVGVNPITAVPTRLVTGVEPRLTVAFADRRTEHLEITALPDFVTEQRNPSNAKGVMRIVVELPAQRLRNGIVFVDTPGLGSLATSGAAETRAYLPQCDLGVVLINAGLTLSEEDLATIQSLYEAGVPASVLLSKADLIAPPDRESALSYIAEQIRQHLGLGLMVQPVSIVGEAKALLDAWFEEEIAPLYARHQQLAEKSVRRKIAALRESVEAALRSKLDRVEGVCASDQEALRHVEKELRRTAGRIPEETSASLRITDEVEYLPPVALREAASRVIERWRRGEEADVSIVSAAVVETSAAVVNQLYVRLSGLARELTGALQQATQQLDVTEVPQEQELVLALREMPQLDFDGTSIVLKRTALVSFAKALAQARLESRLKRLIGPQVSEAFRSYRRLLEAWVRRALVEMQSRFDSHADTYRAQLDRLLGSSEGSPETAEAIRRDLLDIQETMPAGGVANEGEFQEERHAGH
ncbi:MAG: dynamin family protein [Bryobacterales bacterium]|nr:dynamin family protein [Bryobacterales bacterium]